MTTYFCPNCWNESRENFRKCPLCGYSIDEFEQLSYEDKLIVALNHPVMIFRVNAIRQLGNMLSERALRYFEEIISKEKDSFILLEIIGALANIGSQNSLKLLGRLAEDGPEIVKQAARKAIRSRKKI